MNNLNQIINELAPEYRVPVAEAVSLSDGTLASFSAELNSMTWEYPDLPVADVLYLVQATLALA